ncbi:hypothetical protein MP228_002725 [Amoeboaphelidium protococcarum]|nr:hypothetical protein MP228_002725 [Amoeboaphelidium protococcarum]
MEKYAFLQFGHDGAFGQVDFYERIHDGLKVAIKRVYPQSMPRSYQPTDCDNLFNIYKEVEILSKLKHQNIVKYIEHFDFEYQLCLVLEYLETTLDAVISSKDYVMDRKQVLNWTLMLLEGLSFLHNENVMHRDIKPANLMLSHDGSLRICDFGQAVAYKSGGIYSHQVSSRWYRAPEILFGSTKYNQKIDMWSAGCVIAEMFNSKPLFPGQSDINQIIIVFSMLGTPTDENWPSRVDTPDYAKIQFNAQDPLPWTQILPHCSLSDINLISRLLTYEPGRPRKLVEYPGVSILRPLRGLDVNLEADLRTSFELDYPKFQLYLSVADENDPAIEVANKLIAQYPNVDAKLHVGESVIGVNPKINNLIHSYNNAKYDLIWICDSNISIDRDTLLHAVPHFQDPNVGIVHHAPEGINGDSSVGAQLEEHFLNTAHAKIYLGFNWAAVDSCVMGKSTIFRKSDLDKKGGLAAFGKYLAEDNMIGLAIWSMGMRHVMSQKTAKQSLLKSSIYDYVMRRSRWTKIRAYSMPVVTIIEPFTESIVSGLTGAFALHNLFNLPFWTVFGIHMLIWFMCDYMLTILISRQSISNPLWFTYTWILRELSAVPIYIYSILSRNVVQWRGREYLLRMEGLVDRLDNVKNINGDGYDNYRLSMLKSFQSCFVVDLSRLVLDKTSLLLNGNKNYQASQQAVVKVN